MRAHKPKGGADDPVKRIQDRDYVYFIPLVEPVSSIAIAEDPILSYQYCLSDSLLGKSLFTNQMRLTHWVETRGGWRVEQCAVVNTMIADVSCP